MRVADSSFIVEGLLKRKELLEEDLLVTAELAVYETANSIWKHQCVLKDLDDGAPYLAILHELIQSGKIRIIHPGAQLMRNAYSLATKHRRPVYDTIFTALALELDMELATFDTRQSELLRLETRA